VTTSSAPISDHRDEPQGPKRDDGRTRRELQRLATHVLARGRADHGGRFGLRVTPSGIATPAFGPFDTVLRLSGSVLIREHQTPDGAVAETLGLTGRTLAQAAAFAGVDLTSPFDGGHDAPPVGEPDAPLVLDPDAAAGLLSWFAVGARVLDGVLSELSAPTVAQVWPEHFDLGLAAATASGGVTLGASPGDDAVPEPYVYVAPWEAGRPGDPGFWNAPFGAVVTRSSLDRADPVPGAVAFVRRGLALLGPA
jgi:hypothetical protein